MLSTRKHLEIRSWTILKPGIQNSMIEEEISVVACRLVRSFGEWLIMKITVQQSKTRSGKWLISGETFRSENLRAFWSSLNSGLLLWYTGFLKANRPGVAKSFYKALSNALQSTSHEDAEESLSNAYSQCQSSMENLESFVACVVLIKEDTLAYLTTGRWLQPPFSSQLHKEAQNLSLTGIGFMLLITSYKGWKGRDCSCVFHVSLISSVFCGLSLSWNWSGMKGFSNCCLMIPRCHILDKNLMSLDIVYLN